MDSFDMPWSNFVSMMQWTGAEAEQALQRGLVPTMMVNGTLMTTNYQYRWYMNNKPPKRSVSYRTSTDL